MKPEKRKKEPTYCLSVRQIEDLKRRAVREATQAAWILMTSIPVMVLMDKHGFDREQLGKVVDEIIEKDEAYEQGYFTLDDARRVLVDEAGTVIKLPEKEKWVT